MPNYDTGAIRNLLTEIFPDADEIEFFRDDYFQEVEFEADMALKKRAHVLTQYCAQNNQLDKLLTLLQKNFSAKYAEYSAKLVLEETPGAAAASPAPQPAASEVQPPATRAPEAAPPTTTTTPSSQIEASNGRPEVFISYRRKDLVFVTQLHQELAKRGISAWFDQENIEVADHWRTSIAEGIRDCKTFVLVLSPDAVVSVNIRKEVDLAEKYNKRIVPLLWRETEIPPAFDYALAGIQWIDFKETASQENFDELANILKSLIGGASMSEATSQKAIAKESPIPPIQKETATSPKPGGLKRKSAFDPVALGGLVISGLIINYSLDTESQDRYIPELQWLFSATDNLLSIRNGEVSASQPITEPIPPQAEIKDKRANNQILSASFASAFANQVEALFKRIKTHLDNLDMLLLREVQLGEAAKENLGLQAEINGKRVAIVKELQTLAQLMRQAYGVLITSPAELAQLL
jgi:hypothetical protein